MQPRLKILDVFYGNKCNLTCFQCDTRSDIFRKGEHDTELDVIKQGILLASDKFVIENYTLLGGEPLLYKDRVLELAKFIRYFDQTTTIMLPTNGALISKNQEFLLDLITNYNILLVVSDHFSGFADQQKSQKLNNDVRSFAQLLNYDQLDPSRYVYEIFDWDNQKQDPLWQRWLDLAGDNTGEDYSRDLLYLKGRSGIYLKAYDTFLQHHQIENGKPKPFDSDDADLSYQNGCCSPFCTFMYDKKLYKCGALGTLKKFLAFHNSLDDPAWQKYLNYEPLDLETCTEEQVAAFSNSKYRSIDQCTMCPKNTQDFVKTEKHVIPLWKADNV